MPPTSSRNVIALYHDHADTFDRLRDKTLFERGWLTEFLNLLPPLDRRVLDLGSGTGTPVSAWLAQQGCHITGVDGAQAMTDRARHALPEQTWITADMRQLPPLGQFRGLIAWHSLFHLPPEDQRAMFAIFARLSEPGTALLFTSGHERGESMGCFVDQPLYHASLATADYRDLLRQNRFGVVRHVEADPGCGGATVWLAKYRTSAE